jgi:hypothetical protein
VGTEGAFKSALGKVKKDKVRRRILGENEKNNNKYKNNNKNNKNNKEERHWLAGNYSGIEKKRKGRRRRRKNNSKNNKNKAQDGLLSNLRGRVWRLCNWFSPTKSYLMS